MLITRIKGIMFLLLVAVFSFGLAACDAIGGIGGSDEPYRIGVMESVTGAGRNLRQCSRAG